LKYTVSAGRVTDAAEIIVTDQVVAAGLF